MGAENKISKLSKISIKSHTSFEKRGYFNYLTYFHWKYCIMNIENNQFSKMLLNIYCKTYNRFEIYIYLILYKALKKIIQCSIKQINMFILWNNNYINFKAYLNI